MAQTNDTSNDTSDRTPPRRHRGVQQVTLRRAPGSSLGWGRAVENRPQHLVLGPQLPQLTGEVENRLHRRTRRELLGRHVLIISNKCSIEKGEPLP